MIDLHAHILPGLDDGAQDLNDALEMAALAVESGVTVLAATPHCAAFGPQAACRAGTVRQAVRQLRAALEREGIPLQLAHGMEIYGTPEVTGLLTAGQLLCLNGSRYPLVEFAFTDYAASATETLQALRDAGYPIDYEAVKARTNGIPNRAHFALELMEMGYLSSIREGCLTILSPKSGLYTPPKRATAFDTVAFIRSIGAVPVLAHPFLNLNEADLRIFLAEAKPCGLAAMETLYSTFDENLTAKAIAIAEEFGLKQSGGSDFHGSNKPDITMGTGRGNLAIPLEFLHTLESE